MDVGDVDAKAAKLLIPVDLAEYPSNEGTSFHDAKQVLPESGITDSA